MGRPMWILLWICFLLAASDAAATELVFEPSSGSFTDFGVLPQGYGNRVAATSQDGFLYGLNGGATPNVVTRFGTATGLVELYTWTADFGDLQHVVFAQEPVAFEFRLLADSGYVVTLESFEMAGWPHLDFPSIASVSVEDGVGNVLYAQSDVYIYGAAAGPQHTHFAFSGVAASELRIKFDSRTDGHGNVLDSDDVGIDNIQFGQQSAVAVPFGGGSSVAAFHVYAAPNPFRTETTFRYVLSRPGSARLTIIDAEGRFIAQLVDRAEGSGAHSVAWDGRDGHGREVSAGTYFLRFETGGAQLTSRVVLLR